MTKRLSLSNGLAPWIFARLSEYIPTRDWFQLTFLDAFLNGGAVSLYAKSQEFQQILGNDWSDRSQIVGHALLRNQSAILHEADWRIIAGCEPTGEIRADFSPHTFSSRHADLLVQIRVATSHNLTLSSSSEFIQSIWVFFPIFRSSLMGFR